MGELGDVSMFLCWRGGASLAPLRPLCHGLRIPHMPRDAQFCGQNKLILSIAGAFQTIM